MPKKVPMRKDTTYWKFHDEKFSIELKKPDGFLMHYIFKATLGMLSIHPPHPNPPGWLKLFQVQKSHDVATRNMVIMGCGEATGPGFQLKKIWRQNAVTVG